MRNLSKQPSKLGRFWHLNRKRKWLLVYAFGVLSVYKLLLFILPFRYFVKTDSGFKNKVHDSADTYLHECIWAIRVVSSHIPLGFTCLVQALSAKWLLRRGYDVQLRIGVQKNASRGFAAHAWITYNDKTILGEQTGQVFEPILEWK
ncbi:lasso peptide biosynthesis B2 protein [Spirosoma sp. SC4-14]|uniref:lasso peptide biosynthesis B2 protein n=1 Tax=Spirosoma sp. SC4-14 TaxID=3128900 RepID=UPI0030D144D2